MVDQKKHYCPDNDVKGKKKNRFTDQGYPYSRNHRVAHVPVQTTDYQLFGWAPRSEGSFPDPDKRGYRFYDDI